jgi:hypothetical protein
MLIAMTSARASQTEESWQKDYAEAYQQARREEKCLLVWFANDQQSDAEREFASLLNDSELAERLANYVPVQVAKSASVEIDGKSLWLLGHPSFSELGRQPGLAVIDLTDQQSPHYGNLVSLYPYRAGKPMSKSWLKTFLDLPSGTLTQRTLIFAVRTHRESPQSTSGVFDPLLADETTKHSQHQASITLQGHHNWDRRFHLISARLPDRLHAQEVCAESWPGQGLVDAAEECVHSWRQSSGHWSAVRSAHPRYGYDMKRGRNGIWYATGIFGRR